jgi:hypothetical protein
MSVETYVKINGEVRRVFVDYEDIEFHGELHPELYVKGDYSIQNYLAMRLVLRREKKPFFDFVDFDLTLLEIKKIVKNRLEAKLLQIKEEGVVRRDMFDQKSKKILDDADKKIDVVASKIKLASKVIIPVLIAVFFLLFIGVGPTIASAKSFFHVTQIQKEIAALNGPVDPLIPGYKKGLLEHSIFLDVLRIIPVVFGLWMLYHFWIFLVELSAWYMLKAAKQTLIQRSLRYNIN